MADSNVKSGKKIFDIKLLPMDIGRLFYIFLHIVFFTKKIYVTPTAKKRLKGGAIIAANHTSFVDPLLLGNHYWYRRMFFLAAEVVMRNNIFRGPLKGIGCIEIDRSICDVDSIRKSISVLKGGHLLAVFPQGGIDRTADLSTIKSGIILMAMQSKTPIVPVYVHKKNGFWDRNCIVIGEPLTFFAEGQVAKLSDIDTYAELLYEKMSECRNLYEQTEEKKNGKNR